MNLDQQLDKWQRSGRWDKIVRTIEKIRPLKRTPNQNMILAGSYINSAMGDFSKRKNFLKAISLLQAQSNKYGGGSGWNVWMGNATFNLNQWSRAARYYGCAMHTEYSAELEKKYTQLVANSERNLVQSTFFEPFDFRVKKTWKEFEKREQEYRNILRKDPTKWSSISGQVQSIFETGIEELPVIVDNDEGNFEIFFEGNGNPLRLFELQYLMDHAPESIKQNWSMYIGAPISWFNPENDKDEANHVNLWIEKEENGIISLNAFCHGFDPARFEPLESALEHVESLISVVVGRCVCDKFLKINEIVTAQPSPSVETFPLRELPNLLLKRGIDVRTNSEVILNLPTPYMRKLPNELKDQQYRDDIISGTTLCMKALEEYRESDLRNWEQLEADGAAVGYLFYRLDNFTGENKEEEIKKFREDLKKEILEKAGSDSVKIIGEAHGRDFDYIDIMAWNSGKVFEVAQDYLRTTSVPFSGYHPLRKNCGNIVLTGKNRWADNHSIERDPAFSPYPYDALNKDVQNLQKEILNT